MGKEFGQDPFELMKRWTERQLNLALAWMAEGWNRPDRADHYAMQTAREVRMIYCGLTGDKLPDEFKVRFGGGGEKPFVSTPESRAQFERWQSKLAMARFKLATPILGKTTKEKSK